MDFTREPSELYPPMTIRSFPYSIIEWYWSGIGSSGPIERLSKGVRFSKRDVYVSDLKCIALK